MMEFKFKYKEDWPKIIEVSKEYNFDSNNSLLLLAILEIDEEEGNEIHKLESIGKDIQGRARVYARWLRNKEIQYNKYLKEDVNSTVIPNMIEYIMGNKAIEVSNYMNIIEQQLIVPSSKESE